MLLAGRDLRDYALEDVRRAIAVAGQESHLFSTTIRDNLLLGRPGAEPRELEQALRRARIWDWIERLPDGLDTRVGECGRELSGRAAAARSSSHVRCSRTPRCSSSMSRRPTWIRTRRSELVSDVLSAVPDRTVLLITHRTEGLDLVDRVVTLP